MGERELDVFALRNASLHLGRERATADQNHLDYSRMSRCHLDVTAVKAVRLDYSRTGRCYFDVTGVQTVRVDYSRTGMPTLTFRT